MKDVNMHITKAGNSKGGGSSKQMQKNGATGSVSMAQGPKIDKYMATTAKGGAKNGRVKGC